MDRHSSKPYAHPLAQWFQLNTATGRFVVISFIVCIAYYVLLTINGRNQMSDFRVYYDAAHAFLNHTQLYGKSFGLSSGYYKYSPFALIPFFPLALLPFAVASKLFYLLITVAIIWFALKMQRTLAHDMYGKTGWILTVTVLFLADHLERELSLGNIYLFLLICIYWIYYFLLHSKEKPAGILYGLLLLFKPHFLILLPYFVWKKKWMTMACSILVLFMGLFIPALFEGWAANWKHIGEWIHAMQAHSIRLQQSPNTIYGIFNGLILQQKGKFISVVILLSIVAISFFIWMLKNNRLQQNNEIRYLEFFFLVAIIPNLVHTDTEHFMWTWPLIAFILHHLFYSIVPQKWIWISVLALAFLPYCLNTPDLIGKKGTRFVDYGGGMGIANILLIGTALVIGRLKR